MLTHAVTSDLGMIKDHFQFIWKHFHVQDKDKDKLNDDAENDNKEEGNNDSNSCCY